MLSLAGPFLLTVLLLSVSAYAEPDEVCVPIWIGRGMPGIDNYESSGLTTDHITDFSCINNYALAKHELTFAARHNVVTGTTELYEGDYNDNRIVRYDIDPLFETTEVPLPLLYGVCWLAVDLDLDGQLELVVQRGEEGGLGGDGYLDIHSAPDWQLHTRFVMPGMKTSMHPVAINIDEDPYLELYLTPNSAGGSAARAQLIKYDASSGQFVRIADVEAPGGTAGQSAVGDFDGDGRMEFITGNSRGYGLFEYDGDTLHFIERIVDDGFISNNFCASTVTPIPGGGLMALLGHSDSAYRYRLMRATGDNEFEIVHDFIKATGWSGTHPNYAADTDCDGLDEIFMKFYPIMEVWEWDIASSQFVMHCSYDAANFGSASYVRTADLNQNGRPEWAVANSTRGFHTFEDPRCSACLRIPDMISWWPMDGSSGENCADFVGGMPGIVNGSPQSVPGSVSSALEFGGAGDFVSVADGAAIDIGDTDFTIEAWIRADAVTALNPIISHWDIADEIGWSLWISNGDQLCFRVADGVAVVEACAGAIDLADDNWHHIALALNRSTGAIARLYLDGAEIGSANLAAVNGEIRPQASLLIATESLAPGDSSFFAGAIDEVTIYRSALDPGTIQAIFDNGSLGKCKTWVTNCDCADHGDVAGNGTMPDIVDVATIIDYVFRGSAAPPTDSKCPHVDRADINCDGHDDIADVVDLIDIAFRGANRTPCNPCACLPYPLSCQ